MLTARKPTAYHAPGKVRGSELPYIVATVSQFSLENIDVEDDISKFSWSDLPLRARVHRT
jgi:hypothetical protein